ncbi:uncharacterized protein FOMMEDRAFT_109308 [Fomitiporia mediterranea MF3/22]|uniref:uncharacterized protein n=1 Tax=Fomitiporia mediterranea (strain MF3/22) TaxID=694068 RepID=UPI000440892F|nr:uncharacterized protein FOMMEDRAFT_109308 [Fomitiporia mediterranea MF3/22]EJD02126.1 hypothetical protein FOMMEDRAFT_109308 [Fomitiporia mediterranea MF3/22]
MKNKTRRRKVPVTASSNTKQTLKANTSSSSSANPRTSARIIRQFHVLLKRKTQLEKRHARRLENSTEEEAIQREIRNVEDEIARMGGLEAYQRMSSIGQGKDRGGGSERVLVEWLTELGIGDEKGKGKEKLRMLEVGALKPDNYASCSTWVDVHPIDLRSSHPGIVEQDFLQTDMEENTEAWDAISLSLVVNFVPEPRDRGRMLDLAYNMLREDGFLFLVLPLPCVSNSRYLTSEHLAHLMEYIGFTKVKERWKAEGGKMAYWLFKKKKFSSEGRPSSEPCLNSGFDAGIKSADDSTVRFDKKVVLREGKRNNFCILL